MYELSIETEFCAAHAIAIAGKREPNHGHNWKLTVTVMAGSLDKDGLVVDFHALERMVAEIIGPYKNADLNRIPPFDKLNPTAENVARTIFDRISERLNPAKRGLVISPPRIGVLSVRLTEAPGCAVVYRA